MSLAASESSSLPGFPRLSAVDPMGVAQSLADASAAIARLDQASGSHPLAQALLFRTRLDAVRRMAAVDGALMALLQSLVEGAKAAVDRRVGLSGGLNPERGVEKLDHLGQGRGAEVEGTLDDAGLAANIAGYVEG